MLRISLAVSMPFNNGIDTARERSDLPELSGELLTDHHRWNMDTG